MRIVTNGWSNIEARFKCAPIWAGNRRNANGFQCAI